MALRFCFVLGGQGKISRNQVVFKSLLIVRVYGLLSKIHSIQVRLHDIEDLNFLWKMIWRTLRTSKRRKLKVILEKSWNCFRASMNLLSHLRPGRHHNRSGSKKDQRQVPEIERFVYIH